jgi:formylglycine-generating enzyme required for sulfatase activity
MLRVGIGTEVDITNAAQFLARSCELSRACDPKTAIQESTPKASRGAFAKQTGICEAAKWIDIPSGSTVMRWKMGTVTDTAEAKISAFRIRATEVTQCQYLACVKARKCKAPDLTQMQASDAAMLPVTGVTHAQAEAYCAWEGGRLPSEAEWVYAAQGSGQPKYPWGDQDPECLGDGKICATEMSLAGATSFDVSPFGVRDMAGTVSEWTGDWFARWLRAPGTDPMGPASGKEIVVRGGSVAAPVVALQSRSWLPPDRALPSIGFRCVRAVPVAKGGR